MRNEYCNNKLRESTQIKKAWHFKNAKPFILLKDYILFLSEEYTDWNSSEIEVGS